MRWQGKHTFSGPVQFAGGVTGILPWPSAAMTFFVDSRSWGAGSDDNLPGTNPDKPLAKVQTAIDLCVEGRGDYVIMLDGYDNDESTILVNKKAVHIIGVGNWNHAAPWVWLKVNSGAAPVFTLVQQDCSNCEIAGLALAGNASNPCITSSVGTGSHTTFVHLHHLAFAASGDAAYIAQDGIFPIDASCLGTPLIEDCKFGDQITRDGIRFKNMNDGLIRNCFFDNCGERGIHSDAGGTTNGMPDCIDNIFRANHGASEGWAIDTGTATNGLILGNRATSDFDTSGANPYLDTGDANQWCMNYQWNEVMTPATT